MTMKKLMAIVLALVMAVCVFTACSKEETKVENPAAATSEEDQKAISEVAKNCLDKIVALDETAVEYTVEEKGAFTTISSRIAKTAAFKDSFVGAIDKWEIADADKETLKALAAEKADAILASFTADEIGEFTVNGDKANVNCTAALLNISAPEYGTLFTVDAEAIKTMSIEELTKTVEDIAANAQKLVVATEVSFMFSKVDNNWVILNAGISAAE